MPEKMRLDFWMADLRLVVLMAGLTTQSPGAECHSQPAIKRHCRTFKPHLNQREEMVREGSFRGDDFYIHPLSL
jgi:hypothetical protein